MRRLVAAFLGFALTISSEASPRTGEHAPCGFASLVAVSFCPPPAGESLEGPFEKLGSFVRIRALQDSSPPAQEQPTNTTPRQPGGLLGRPSPPQPTQRQGLEYFVGSWAFTWTGRESPLTAGPRTGTVSYTRLGETNFLESKTEGRSDAAGAYKESAAIGWHETQKVLAVHERLASGVELLSVGDWTSPIAIRLESAPVTIEGETVRLRRTVGIVSSHSFTVNEELSTDGGPFVRLGGGVFTKK